MHCNAHPLGSWGTFTFAEQSTFINYPKNYHILFEGNLFASQSTLLKLVGPILSRFCRHPLGSWGTFTLAEQSTFINYRIA